MSLTYWTGNTFTGSNGHVQFERQGHPGKLIKTHHFKGGIFNATGSEYGYSSLMVVAAGGATASFSAGGQISCGDLPAGTIYDFSVMRLSGSAATSEIYLFKRQQ